VRRLDAHVVFMPMERHDVRHAHAVLSRMTAPDRGRILHSAYTPGQVLGLMSHLDLVVGMRLHFLMFAAVSGLPVLPLPYAGKVFDFARRLGAPALVGVAREQVGLLLAEVDRLWDEFPQRRVDLGARVRALRELAGETCARCGALLDAMDREGDDRDRGDTTDRDRAADAVDRAADASDRLADGSDRLADASDESADVSDGPVNTSDRSTNSVGRPANAPIGSAGAPIGSANAPIGSAGAGPGGPADPVGTGRTPAGDTPVPTPHGLHLLRPAPAPAPGPEPGPGAGPGRVPDPDPGPGVVPGPEGGAVRSGGAGQEA
jgi:hypothetical protein